MSLKSEELENKMQDLQAQKYDMEDTCAKQPDFKPGFNCRCPPNISSQVLFAQGIKGVDN